MVVSLAHIVGDKGEHLLPEKPQVPSGVRCPYIDSSYTLIAGESQGIPGKRAGIPFEKTAASPAGKGQRRETAGPAGGRQEAGGALFPGRRGLQMRVECRACWWYTFLMAKRQNYGEKEMV